MEAVRSSETSANFYGNTECQNPEECNINSHYCENLIPFIPVFASLKFFKIFTRVYNFGLFFFYRSNAPVGLVLLTVEALRSQSGRNATFCRIPLHEWSVRRRDLCMSSHVQNSQETNIHAPAGFEPAVPASGMPQTHALDRSATGIRKFSL